MPLLRPTPHILDISLPISPELPTWPGDPSPTIEPMTTVERHGVRVSRLVLGTHTGTHLDAPSHFLAGGRTIDQLDLVVLVGPCCLIDVMHEGGPLTRAALQPFNLQPGARVLLKTENSRQPLGPGFRSDFVALAPDAAEYLCERRVQLIGIDGPSVDLWGNEDFPCHKRLLGADILILENLVLRHVKPGIYHMVAAPLNLRGADGSPVRAFLIRAPVP